MTSWRIAIELWRFDSASWLIGFGALVTYAASFGLRADRRTAAFIAALGLFLLATVSPIAVLADGYLFSAHVVQHLLLLLLVPPLLIASVPPCRAEPLLRRPSARLIEDTFGRVPVSWLLGLGIMWLWHVPALCTASVTSTPVYVTQCATLLLAGTAFYWPVMHPLSRERLSAPACIGYLFAGCLGCSLLGILLTFAPVSACPVYMHPVDALGVMPVVRQQWGLTHAADQELGGLMMWIPACLVYLAAILVIVKAWLDDHSPDHAQRKGSHGLS